MRENSYQVHHLRVAEFSGAWLVLLRFLPTPKPADRTFPVPWTTCIQQQQFRVEDDQHSFRDSSTILSLQENALSPAGDVARLNDLLRCSRKGLWLLPYIAPTGRRRSACENARGKGYRRGSKAGRHLTLVKTIEWWKSRSDSICMRALLARLVIYPLGNVAAH